MANTNNCTNCGSENPYYQLKCNKCHSFIRRRVVNIELWENIGKVIESPSKAFENIIFAEHKNFLILMMFLFGLTIFADLNLVSNILFEESILFTALISFGIIIGSVFINAFLVKTLLSAFNTKTRFLDNYYLSVFANVPQILSLILLLPVQFALFGEFWFTFNPSPFLIKAAQAYIIIGLEIILILWSVILTFVGFNVTAKSYLQSLFATLLTIFMTYLLPLFLIYNLF